jgi:hypothetical protein
MPPPMMRRPRLRMKPLALAGVDAEVDQALDRPGRQAVAADLLAREGRLLQQQDVQPGLREGVRRSTAPGTCADDDDVGGRGDGGAVEHAHGEVLSRRGL